MYTTRSLWNDSISPTVSIYLIRIIIRKRRFQIIFWKENLQLIAASQSSDEWRHVGR